MEKMKDFTMSFFERRVLMKIATKRKIKIIVLILIVCMVSLGACGKGEEDYRKEIATLAEEQGLEDVEVSLEATVYKGLQAV